MIEHFAYLFHLSSYSSLFTILLYLNKLIIIWVNIEMSDQVIIGHYILGRTIGSGGFARVKSKCTNNLVARHNLTNIEVAVKIINKKKMKNKNMISKVSSTHMLRWKDRSEFWNLLTTQILSNFMKCLIQPMISLLSCNTPIKDNSTNSCKAKR